jgi:hypothetical protein
LERFIAKKSILNVFRSFILHDSSLGISEEVTIGKKTLLKVSPKQENEDPFEALGSLFGGLVNIFPSSQRKSVYNYEIKTDGQLALRCPDPSCSPDSLLVDSSQDLPKICMYIFHVLT